MDMPVRTDTPYRTECQYDMVQVPYCTSLVPVRVPVPVPGLLVQIVMDILLEKVITNYIISWIKEVTKRPLEWPTKRQKLYINMLEISMSSKGLKYHVMPLSAGSPSRMLILLHLADIGRQLHQKNNCQKNSQPAIKVCKILIHF